MVAKNKKFKKKSSAQSVFFYVLLGLLALIIIGFLAVSNVKISNKRKEMLAQISYLENEIKTLSEKKEKLEAGISEQGTEDFMEKEAREKLGLKKSGEEVVVVMPSETNQDEKTQEQKSFWQKLLETLHLRQ